MILGKFHAVTTKDFYAYDNGMRFDGDALMQAIQKQHAAGYVYEWNVTQPEVHVAGNVAWITYVNKGTVKKPEGTASGDVAGVDGVGEEGWEVADSFCA